MKTAHQIRQSFKSIGYTVSIRSNPLNPAIANLVVTGKGLVKFMLSSATAMSADTFESHRAMFDLANSIRGSTVGELKIS